MRDHKLDRLFDRFRERGDAGALGRVFDATAPELLRVAMSLVRDPGEADDLLQATYLTAIEKAHAYDASRRLVPWLLGILVRHAHAGRRKRPQRIDPTVDPDGLESTATPEAKAEAHELSEALSGALDAIPARYREVLRAFLQDGHRAADIAKATGQAPGTVRMQIHRGLDHLRKALPAGFAFGALGSLVGPGLDVVRASVMREATAAAGGLALASATVGTGAAVAPTTTTFGGIVMAKKITLAAALALAAGLTWFATQGTSAPTEAKAVAPGEVSDDLADGSEPTARETELSPVERETRRGTVTPEALESESAFPPEYLAALSGVTGRIIEFDGTPIPDLEVVLIEGRPAGMQRPIATSFQPGGYDPDLLLSSARTDATGRFHLGEAQTNALHALGIDLGGERPDWRVIDRDLQPGEALDLGDIALAPASPVSGRVLDEAGNPIEGARVRSADLPPTALDLGFADIRAGDPVLVSRMIFQFVLDQPAWIANLESRMPFPTTTTGSDGRFELPGAPLEEVTLVIDKPGFVGTVTYADRPARSGELGDFVLARGRVVQGKVVDAAGQPVPGAEVRGGALLQTGLDSTRFAVLCAEDETGEDGSFQLTGIRSSESTDVPIALVARRTPLHPWKKVMPKAEGAEGAVKQVEIELGAEIPVTLVLRDESGAVVPEAEVVVQVPMPAIGEEWYSIFDAGRTFGTSEKLEDGRYALLGIERGDYVVRARAPGYAVVEHKIKPRRKDLEVELTFRPKTLRTVTVVDAETKAPIAAAQVTVATMNTRSVAVERARSGTDGRVTFEELEAVPEMPYFVRVQHPAYATLQSQLGRSPAAGGEPEDEVFELARGGSLVAHVRARGQAPPRRLVLTLDAMGASYPDNEITRFGLLDESGDTLISNLPPGEYRWTLWERYLNTSVASIVAGDVDKDWVTAGQITIRAGEAAEVHIEVSEEEGFLDAPSGRIGGRIRVDGEPPHNMAVWAYVNVDGSSHSEHSTLDGRGRFAFENMPAGEVQLNVQETKGDEDGWTIYTVFSHTYALSPDEDKWVELDWKTSTITVMVTGEDGAILEGAHVSLTGQTDENSGTNTIGSTDADGAAVLRSLLPGRYELRANHVEAGIGRTFIDVLPEAGPVIADVRVNRGVPCSGKITITEEVKLSRWGTSISFVEKDGWRSRGQLVDFEDRKAEFEVTGLAPGTYVVRLYGVEQPAGPHEVTIGPSGALDLDFTFTTLEDAPPADR